MKKYLVIFKTSFQHEFVYPVNFIMWRARNVMTFFLTFFLWDTVYSQPNLEIFGYDRAKIMTYVFLVVFLRAIVVSSKTVNLTGEISDGKLSNYLLKPINLFGYWFSRDLASKLLNLLFACGEVFVLYLIFRPQMFLPNNIVSLIVFILFLCIAIVMYFLLIFLVSSTPLWVPEQSWAPIFLFFTIIEFLSGAFFPLDILPENIQNIFYLTPFPYLIFTPVQAFLGNMDFIEIVKSLLVSCVWIVLLIFLIRYIWKKGLKEYKSDGR